MAAYCWACANRPNKISATSTPRIRPRTLKAQTSPMSSPMTTKTARTPRPLPMTIGIAFGFDLWSAPAAMRSCFSRPALAGFAAASFVTAESAAPAFLDMRAMLRSIRLSRPGQKPPGSGEFRATPNRHACARTLPCRDGTGPLLDGLGVQPAGPVGGPHQRSGHHAREPEFGRLLPQFHELLDPARLALVERQRLAGVDLAEVAPPGALVAADEEGRLAVLPALEDVRAAGFLADRVQAFAPDQRLQLRVGRPGAQPGLDPRRLPLDRDLAVAGFEAEHAPAFGCEYHPSRVCRRRPTAVRGTA